LYKSPSIDVSNSGLIHIAYANVSTLYRAIEYRQCWTISDSLNTAFWGNASKVSGGKDIILSNGTGGNMSEPSLVCDATGVGRVWVVSSELTQNNQYNIWYIMEDFEDSNYWSMKFLIDSDPIYELKNPNIGFDNAGTLYCVWEKRFTASDIQIYLSSNISTSWSQPQQITNQDKNIYPQIPKNLTGNNNQFGFIYKDDTNDNIMFHQIPEFSDISEMLIIILILQLFFVQIKKIKRKNKFLKQNFSNSGVRTK
jgi:hypothetical protein